MNNIKTIIDEWDPISLFPLSPSDEYKNEIDIIERSLKNKDNHRIEKLGKVIYETFIETFGDSVFQKTPQDCCVIAQRILLDLE